ncbi:hypothetical protein QQF64_033764 [Cirrhinus molitorella]|uniref:Reverse transcriptase/retrotransposon-derived protein RNase H-like domain-containing protein n=1 Tax=Cirrhinus molitorella TaxID=172907 RepID=A0ABR3MUW7_9TELE
MTSNSELELLSALTELMPAYVENLISGSEKGVLCHGKRNSKSFSGQIAPSSVSMTSNSELELLSALTELMPAYVENLISGSEKGVLCHGKRNSKSFSGQIAPSSVSMTSNSELELLSALTELMPAYVENLISGSFLDIPLGKSFSGQIAPSSVSMTSNSELELLSALTELMPAYVDVENLISGSEKGVLCHGKRNSKSFSGQIAPSSVSMTSNSELELLSALTELMPAYVENLISGSEKGVLCHGKRNSKSFSGQIAPSSVSMTSNSELELLSALTELMPAYVENLISGSFSGQIAPSSVSMTRNSELELLSALTELMPAYVENLISGSFSGQIAPSSVSMTSNSELELLSALTELMPAYVENLISGSEKGVLCHGKRNSKSFSGQIAPSSVSMTSNSELELLSALTELMPAYVENLISGSEKGVLCHGKRNSKSFSGQIAPSSVSMTSNSELELLSALTELMPAYVENLISGSFSGQIAPSSVSMTSNSELELLSALTELMPAYVENLISGSEKGVLCHGKRNSKSFSGQIAPSSVSMTSNSELELLSALTELMPSYVENLISGSEKGVLCHGKRNSKSFSGQIAPSSVSMTSNSESELLSALTELMPAYVENLISGKTFLAVLEVFLDIPLGKSFSGQIAPSSVSMTSNSKSFSGQIAPSSVSMTSNSELELLSALTELMPVYVENLISGSFLDIPLGKSFSGQIAPSSVSMTSNSELELLSALTELMPAYVENLISGSEKGVLCHGKRNSKSFSGQIAPSSVSMTSNSELELLSALTELMPAYVENLISGSEKGVLCHGKRNSKSFSGQIAPSSVSMTSNSELELLSALTELMPAYVENLISGSEKGVLCHGKRNSKSFSGQIAPSSVSMTSNSELELLSALTELMPAYVENLISGSEKGVLCHGKRNSKSFSGQIAPSSVSMTSNSELELLSALTELMPAYVENLISGSEKGVLCHGKRNSKSFSGQIAPSSVSMTSNSELELLSALTELMPAYVENLISGSEKGVLCHGKRNSKSFSGQIAPSSVSMTSNSELELLSALTELMPALMLKTLFLGQRKAFYATGREIARSFSGQIAPSSVSMTSNSELELLSALTELMPAYVENLISGSFSGQIAPSSVSMTSNSELELLSALTELMPAYVENLISGSEKGVLCHGKRNSKSFSGQIAPSSVSMTSNSELELLSALTELMPAYVENLISGSEKGVLCHGKRNSKSFSGQIAPSSVSMTSNSELELLSALTELMPAYVENLISGSEKGVLCHGKRNSKSFSGQIAPSSVSMTSNSELELLSALTELMPAYVENLISGSEKGVLCHGKRNSKSFSGQIAPSSVSMTSNSELELLSALTELMPAYVENLISGSEKGVLCHGKRNSKSFSGQIAPSSVSMTSNSELELLSALTELMPAYVENLISGSFLDIPLGKSFSGQIAPSSVSMTSNSKSFSGQIAPSSVSMTSNSELELLSALTELMPAYVENLISGSEKGVLCHGKRNSKSFSGQIAPSSVSMTSNSELELLSALTELMPAYVENLISGSFLDIPLGKSFSGQIAPSSVSMTSNSELELLSALTELMPAYVENLISGSFSGQIAPSSVSMTSNSELELLSALTELMPAYVENLISGSEKGVLCHGKRNSKSFSGQIAPSSVSMTSNSELELLSALTELMPAYVENLISGQEFQWSDRSVQPVTKFFDIPLGKSFSGQIAPSSVSMTSTSKSFSGQIAPSSVSMTSNSELELLSALTELMPAYVENLISGSEKGVLCHGKRNSKGFSGQIAPSSVSMTSNSELELLSALTELMPAYVENLISGSEKGVLCHGKRNSKSFSGQIAPSSVSMTSNSELELLSALTELMPAYVENLISGSEKGVLCHGKRNSKSFSGQIAPSSVSMTSNSELELLSALTELMPAYVENLISGSFLDIPLGKSFSGQIAPSSVSMTSNSELELLSALTELMPAYVENLISGSEKGVLCHGKRNSKSFSGQIAPSSVSMTSNSELELLSALTELMPSMLKTLFLGKSFSGQIAPSSVSMTSNSELELLSALTELMPAYVENLISGSEKGVLCHGKRNSKSFSGQIAPSSVSMTSNSELELLSALTELMPAYVENLISGSEKGVLCHGKRNSKSFSGQIAPSSVSMTSNSELELLSALTELMPAYVENLISGSEKGVLCHGKRNSKSFSGQIAPSSVSMTSNSELELLSALTELMPAYVENLISGSEKGVLCHGKRNSKSFSGQIAPSSVSMTSNSELELLSALTELMPAYVENLISGSEKGVLCHGKRNSKSFSGQIAPSSVSMTSNSRSFSGQIAPSSVSMTSNSELELLSALTELMPAYVENLISGSEKGVLCHGKRNSKSFSGQIAPSSVSMTSNSESELLSALTELMPAYVENLISGSEKGVLCHGKRNSKSFSGQIAPSSVSMTSNSELELLSALTELMPAYVENLISGSEKGVLCHGKRNSKSFSGQIAPSSVSMTSNSELELLSALTELMPAYVENLISGSEKGVLCHGKRNSKSFSGQIAPSSVSMTSNSELELLSALTELMPAYVENLISGSFSGQIAPSSVSMTSNSELELLSALTELMPSYVENLISGSEKGVLCHGKRNSKSFSGQIAPSSVSMTSNSELELLSALTELMPAYVENLISGSEKGVLCHGKRNSKSFSGQIAPSSVSMTSNSELELLSALTELMPAYVENLISGSEKGVLCHGKRNSKSFSGQIAPSSVSMTSNSELELLSALTELMPAYVENLISGSEKGVLCHGKRNSKSFSGQIAPSSVSMTSNSELELLSALTELMPAYVENLISGSEKGVLCHGKRNSKSFSGQIAPSSVSMTSNSELELLSALTELMPAYVENLISGSEKGVLCHGKRNSKSFSGQIAPSSVSMTSNSELELLSALTELMPAYVENLISGSEKGVLCHGKRNSKSFSGQIAPSSVSMTSNSELELLSALTELMPAYVENLISGSEKGVLCHGKRNSKSFSGQIAPSSVSMTSNSELELLSALTELMPAYVENLISGSFSGQIAPSSVSMTSNSELELLSALTELMPAYVENLISGSEKGVLCHGKRNSKSFSGQIAPSSVSMTSNSELELLSALTELMPAYVENLISGSEKGVLCHGKRNSKSFSGQIAPSSVSMTSNSELELLSALTELMPAYVENLISGSFLDIPLGKSFSGQIAPSSVSMTSNSELELLSALTELMPAYVENLISGSFSGQIAPSSVSMTSNSELELLSALTELMPAYVENLISGSFSGQIAPSSVSMTSNSKSFSGQIAPSSVSMTSNSKSFSGQIAPSSVSMTSNSELELLSALTELMPAYVENLISGSEKGVLCHGKRNSKSFSGQIAPSSVSMTSNSELELLSALTELMPAYVENLISGSEKGVLCHGKRNSKSFSGQIAPSSVSMTSNSKSFSGQIAPSSVSMTSNSELELLSALTELMPAYVENLISGSEKGVLCHGKRNSKSFSGQIAPSSVSMTSNSELELLSALTELMPAYVENLISGSEKGVLCHGKRNSKSFSGQIAPSSVSMTSNSELELLSALTELMPAYVENLISGSFSGQIAPSSVSMTSNSELELLSALTELMPSYVENLISGSFSGQIAPSSVSMTSNSESELLSALTELMPAYVENLISGSFSGQIAPSSVSMTSNSELELRALTELMPAYVENLISGQEFQWSDRSVSVSMTSNSELELLSALTELMPAYVENLISGSEKGVLCHGKRNSKSFSGQIAPSSVSMTSNSELELLSALTELMPAYVENLISGSFLDIPLGKSFSGQIAPSSVSMTSNSELELLSALTELMPSLMLKTLFLGRSFSGQIAPSSVSMTSNSELELLSALTELMPAYVENLISGSFSGQIAPSSVSMTSNSESELLRALTELMPAYVENLISGSEKGVLCHGKRNSKSFSGQIAPSSVSMTSNSELELLSALTELMPAYVENLISGSEKGVLCHGKRNSKSFSGQIAPSSVSMTSNSELELLSALTELMPAYVENLISGSEKGVLCHGKRNSKSFSGQIAPSSVSMTSNSELELLSALTELMPAYVENLISGSFSGQIAPSSVSMTSNSELELLRALTELMPAYVENLISGSEKGVLCHGKRNSKSFSGQIAPSSVSMTSNSELELLSALTELMPAYVENLISGSEKGVLCHGKRNSKSFSGQIAPSSVSMTSNSESELLSALTELMPAYVENLISGSFLDIPLGKSFSGQIAPSSVSMTSNSELELLSALTELMPAYVENLISGSEKGVLCHGKRNSKSFSGQIAPSSVSMTSNSELELLSALTELMPAYVENLISGSFLDIPLGKSFSGQIAPSSVSMTSNSELELLSALTELMPAYVENLISGSEKGVLCHGKRNSKSFSGQIAPSSVSMTSNSELELLSALTELMPAYVENLISGSFLDIPLGKSFSGQIAPSSVSMTSNSELELLSALTELMPAYVENLISGSFSGQIAPSSVSMTSNSELELLSALTELMPSYVENLISGSFSGQIAPSSVSMTSNSRSFSGQIAPSSVSMTSNSESELLRALTELMPAYVENLISGSEKGVLCHGKRNSKSFSGQIAPSSVSMTSNSELELLSALTELMPAYVENLISGSEKGVLCHGKRNSKSFSGQIAPSSVSMTSNSESELLSALTELMPAYVENLISGSFLDIPLGKSFSGQIAPSSVSMTSNSELELLSALTELMPSYVENLISGSFSGQIAPSSVSMTSNSELELLSALTELMPSYVENLISGSFLDIPLGKSFSGQIAPSSVSMTSNSELELLSALTELMPAYVENLISGSFSGQIAPSSVSMTSNSELELLSALTELMPSYVENLISGSFSGQIAPSSVSMTSNSELELLSALTELMPSYVENLISGSFLDIPLGMSFSGQIAPSSVSMTSNSELELLSALTELMPAYVENLISGSFSGQIAPSSVSMTSNSESELLSALTELMPAYVENLISGKTFLAVLEVFLDIPLGKSFSGQIAPSSVSMTSNSELELLSALTELMTSYVENLISGSFSGQIAPSSVSMTSNSELELLSALTELMPAYVENLISGSFLDIPLGKSFSGQIAPSSVSMTSNSELELLSALTELMPAYVENLFSGSFSGQIAPSSVSMTSNSELELLSALTELMPSYVENLISGSFSGQIAPSSVSMTSNSELELLSALTELMPSYVENLISGSEKGVLCHGKRNSKSFSGQIAPSSVSMTSNSELELLSALTELMPLMLKTLFKKDVSRCVRSFLDIPLGKSFSGQIAPYSVSMTSNSELELLSALTELMPSYVENLISGSFLDIPLGKSFSGQIAPSSVSMTSNSELELLSALTELMPSYVENLISGSFSGQIAPSSVSMTSNSESELLSALTELMPAYVENLISGSEKGVLCHGKRNSKSFSGQIAPSSVSMTSNSELELLSALTELMPSYVENLISGSEKGVLCHGKRNSKSFSGQIAPSSVSMTSNSELELLSALTELMPSYVENLISGSFSGQIAPSSVSMTSNSELELLSALTELMPSYVENLISGSFSGQIAPSSVSMTSNSELELLSALTELMPSYVENLISGSFSGQIAPSSVSMTSNSELELLSALTELMPLMLKTLFLGKSFSGQIAPSSVSMTSNSELELLSALTELMPAYIENLFLGRSFSGQIAPSSVSMTSNSELELLSALTELMPSYVENLISGSFSGQIAPSSVSMTSNSKSFSGQIAPSSVSMTSNSELELLSALTELMPSYVENLISGSEKGVLCHGKRNSKSFSGQIAPSSVSMTSNSELELLSALTELMPSYVENLISGSFSGQIAPSSVSMTSNSELELLSALTELMPSYVENLISGSFSGQIAPSSVSMTSNSESELLSALTELMPAYVENLISGSEKGVLCHGKRNSKSFSGQIAPSSVSMTSNSELELLSALTELMPFYVENLISGSEKGVLCHGKRNSKSFSGQIAPSSVSMTSNSELELLSALTELMPAYVENLISGSFSGQIAPSSVSMTSNSESELLRALTELMPAYVENLISGSFSGQIAPSSVSMTSNSESELLRALTELMPAYVENLISGSFLDIPLGKSFSGQMAPYSVSMTSNSELELLSALTELMPAYVENLISGSEKGVLCHGKRNSKSFSGQIAPSSVSMTSNSESELLSALTELMPAYIENLISGSFLDIPLGKSFSGQIAPSSVSMTSNSKSFSGQIAPSSVSMTSNSELELLSALTELMPSYVENLISRSFSGQIAPSSVSMTSNSELELLSALTELMPSYVENLISGSFSGQIAPSSVSMTSNSELELLSALTELMPAYVENLISGSFLDIPLGKSFSGQIAPSSVSMTSNSRSFSGQIAPSSVSMTSNSELELLSALTELMPSYVENLISGSFSGQIAPSSVSMTSNSEIELLSALTELMPSYVENLISGSKKGVLCHGKRNSKSFSGQIAPSSVSMTINSELELLSALTELMPAYFENLISGSFSGQIAPSSVSMTSNSEIELLSALTELMPSYVENLISGSKKGVLCHGKRNSKSFSGQIAPSSVSMTINSELELLSALTELMPSYVENLISGSFLDIPLGKSFSGQIAPYSVSMTSNRVSVVRSLRPSSVSMTSNSESELLSALTELMPAYVENLISGSFLDIPLGKSFSCQMAPYSVSMTSNSELELLSALTELMPSYVENLISGSFSGQIAPSSVSMTSNSESELLSALTELMPAYVENLISGSEKGVLCHGKRNSKSFSGQIAPSSVSMTSNSELELLSALTELMPSYVENLISGSEKGVLCHGKRNSKSFSGQIAPSSVSMTSNSRSFSGQIAPSSVSMTSNSELELLSALTELMPSYVENLISGSFSGQIAPSSVSMTSNSELELLSALTELMPSYVENLISGSFLDIPLGKSFSGQIAPSSVSMTSNSRSFSGQIAPSSVSMTSNSELELLSALTELMPSYVENPISGSFSGQIAPSSVSMTSNSELELLSALTELMPSYVENLISGSEKGVLCHGKRNSKSFSGQIAPSSVSMTSNSELELLSALTELMPSYVENLISGSEKGVLCHGKRNSKSFSGQIAPSSVSMTSNSELELLSALTELMPSYVENLISRSFSGQIAPSSVSMTSNSELELLSALTELMPSYVENLISGSFSGQIAPSSVSMTSNSELELLSALTELMPAYVENLISGSFLDIPLGKSFSGQIAPSSVSMTSNSRSFSGQIAPSSVSMTSNSELELLSALTELMPSYVENPISGSFSGQIAPSSVSMTSNSELELLNALTELMPSYVENLISGSFSGQIAPSSVSMTINSELELLSALTELMPAYVENLISGYRRLEEPTDRGIVPITWECHHAVHAEKLQAAKQKRTRSKPDKDLQLAFMKAVAEAGSYAADRDKQKRGGKGKGGKGQRKTERLSQKWNCWICETDEHDVRKCTKCRLCKKDGRWANGCTEKHEGDGSGSTEEDGEQEGEGVKGEQSPEKGSTCVGDTVTLLEHPAEEGHRVSLTFIPNYAIFEQPLRSLTVGKGLKSTDKIEWTAEAEEAFVNMKIQLSQVPALGLPNADKPFVQMVDEKNGFMTSVLLQHYGDKLQPVAYFSSKLDLVASGLPFCLRAVAAAEQAAMASRDL